MVKAKIEKRRGRPSLGEAAMSEIFSVRFPSRLLEELEAERALHLDNPDRGALIRQLVVEALAARKAKRARRP